MESYLRRLRRIVGSGLLISPAVQMVVVDADERIPAGPPHVHLSQRRPGPMFPPSAAALRIYGEYRATKRFQVR
jgi:hypothetical protein